MQDGRQSRADRSVMRAGVHVIAEGIRARPRPFALSVVGSAVYGVMTAAMAWAVGVFMRDTLTPAVEAGAVTSGDLLRGSAVVFGVVLLHTVGVLTRRIAGAYTIYLLGADFRRRVSRAYLRLPLHWHHSHPSGQLLSNANADVDAAWGVFQPLPMAIGVVVMLVVGILQMVLVDPWLAAVGMVIFPLLLVANSAFQRAVSPLATHTQHMRAEVSEVAHESFEAALVVKSLGREEHETRRFALATDELRRAAVAAGRMRGLFDPIVDAIPTIGILAVLGVGTYRVASGSIDTAAVVQIAYLFAVLSFPVRALGWVLGEIPRSVVGWRRVNDVLQSPGDTTYGSADLPGQDAVTLRLHEVTYTYPDAPEHEVISDVSLHVPSGAVVALVGPTGSGKSTLVDLAMRMVDADSGLVSIDDRDIRTLSREALRHNTALVAQDTFLFDESVRGNVTLGEGFDDTDVWAALEVAEAADFVLDLPEGLDTRIGERGTSLSGGQRQRLALARAVIRSPRLLVLDDATSAVDPSVEQAILASLRARGEHDGARRTTTLLVAHRMATIALADEVVYLEDGRVIDQGPHEVVLQRCPGYHRLVTAYARDAAAHGDGRVDAHHQGSPAREPW